MPNAEIERCVSEKDVLLAWTKIIKREDPDVIIGYNIFGFDYQFMYLRAKDLGCERNFLQLSRNNREVCLNKNWRTGQEGLEENTLVIASGQHDLKFVKMTGRLQVDLYNYLRRDYQLTQYKLDYVSGYFIGDAVKKIEHIDNKTKLYDLNQEIDLNDINQELLTDIRSLLNAFELKKLSSRIKSVLESRRILTAHISLSFEMGANF